MAKQATKQQEPVIPAVSYKVEPYVAKMVDADRNVTEVSAGWMLVREAGGRCEYCGEGLNWRPHPVISVPFETREIAEKQMGFYVRQDAVRSSVIPIETIIAELPYCQIAPTSHGAGVMTLRLAPQELWMVQAMRTALQRMNLERPGGQRIESDAETIRWMLRALLQCVQPD
jgi:hypothetical protein